MNKISSSRPPVSLQASDTGHKYNLEAMQSTKLDCQNLQFFPADLRPLHWITGHANSKLTLKLHCSLVIDNHSKLQKYCCEKNLMNYS